MPELLTALQAMAMDIAQAEGIDEVLFLRLITQESHWIPNANADKLFPACIGLAQLNEYYGRWFLTKHAADLAAGADEVSSWTDAEVRAALLVPRVNLIIAARELKRLLGHWWFGDWQTALAAWNYGSGNVHRLMVEYPKQWMTHLPAETQWMLAVVLLQDGIKEYR